ncbi:hypothetical protein CTheo_621 [Ceratobasidium theobromae]|uniref:Uncharacterized protein n=1 Tax=Ceratobasidium theobromae TaxID=1582974 RepID=A0A5N5QXG6_9AGAM|nr:hypothetical protein CTheo_621 [Ceratobasidium theobromae]
MSLTGSSEERGRSPIVDPPSHIPPEETPKARSRTHSTPRPFEKDIPTPASSRPTSPAVRPSRIPTRPRTGSRQIAASDTTFPPSPDPSPDLWPLKEDALVLTPPTPERPNRRKRDTFVPPPPSDTEEFLFDEPPPFVINNHSLGARSSLDEYEHWYRGEGRGGGGRNGGRGEIRIATRTEMLEIASFGHPPPAGPGYSEFGWRNKAYDDSTVGTRFMWYDENAENVLDEAPLTDLDDVDTESMFHPGSHEAHTVESQQPRDSSDSSVPQADVRSVEPDPEPDGPSDPVTPARPPPSRIARATSPTSTSSTSLISRPGRSPTPSKALSPPQKRQSPKPKSTPQRAATAAATPSKSPSRIAGTSQRSPPPSTSTPKSPRARAASPNGNNTPSPRTRTRAQSTGPRRTKKLSTSGSGPHPLADAIPQINQHIPDDGNWDDMVLPTIARKMQGGDITMLERKPWEEKEEILPPAPGTFGYRERDRTRTRQQKTDSGTEMEEFGAWEVQKPKAEQTEERKKAPSPPPFSDYTPIPPKSAASPPEPARRPAPAAGANGGVVITEADLRHSLPHKLKANEDDSHGARCCKCVVM